MAFFDKILNEIESNMGKREITASFKLHVTVNEINAAVLLKCHYQSPLSVCNNF